MKTAFDNYTRLTKSMLGMSSVWLGSDHLVYVKGSGFLQPFSEEYFRYRFRDIQAFSITKTSRIGMTVLYLLGLLVSSGLIALTLSFRGDKAMGTGMVVFLSLLTLPALTFLFLLLRHLILGPTCNCTIQTSIKRDRIRPLNRLHKARQCIASISEKVNESQQSITLSTGEKGDRKQADAVTPPVGNRLKIPALVIPAYTVLAAFGLFVLAALHLESTTLVSISLLLLIPGSIGLQIALIQSIRLVTPDFIRNSLWILLALVVLNYGAGIVYFVYAAALNPVYTISIAGPLEAFAAAAEIGGTGFYICFLLLASCTTGFALAGSLKSLKWRKRMSTTTTEDAEPPSSEDS